MRKIKPIVIAEIAKQISVGNTCYMVRKNAKVIIIDNSTEDERIIETQNILQVEIEEKIEKYVKIEKINDEDLLLIMRDFIEEVADKSVKKELSNALKRKSPIRNFLMEVEGEMGLNQHWINFNGKERRRWVSNFLIDAFNY